jgi:hypothetical protein
MIREKIMSIFLVTFICLYGAMNLYLFLKARPAFVFGFGVSLATALFLSTMVMAPIAVRLLERQGMHLASRYVAYVAYTWMGLIFFFVWLGLCLDVFNLSMRALSLLPGSVSGQFVWAGRQSFIFLAGGALFLGMWSAYSAWQIRIDQVMLQTAKLPPHTQKLTIAQVSDVHLGPMVGERRLGRIIRLLERAKPDVLVATGDLVDAQMERHNKLAAMLAELNPPLGKFAITGNHEFYAGIGQSERFLKAAGFTLLRNERLNVAEQLYIVGVDDPAVRRRNQTKGDDEESLLAGLSRERFTLLLKHRPTVETESLGKFDLQLSGHTHGGQIFPFHLITRLFYPREDGLHRLEKGSVLYISRGTGTWGPPMRFLSPPEVTVFELARGG